MIDFAFLASIEQELQYLNITQVEVLKLIDTISMYKSSGMYNISSRVIKDFLNLVSREITVLYNLVLDTGVFS